MNTQLAIFVSDFVGMTTNKENELRTFRLHLAYASIEGIILGMLALNEFVFLKSMHGNNYLMSLLFQFSMAVFTGLIFMNEWLKNVPSRSRLLRQTALITRLPLLLLLFFPANITAYENSLVFHYLFLGIFLIYYLGALVINPNINFLLKTNYQHQNFGKYYSYATSANKIIMMLVTFGYGILLDNQPYAFRFSLPLAGILGMISLGLLSKIHHPLPVISQQKSVRESAKKSVHEMLNTLKNNKAYRDFEWGFMFYGIAFMVSVTVIAIYFYEGLDMNYSSVAFYRNAYNLLAIFLLPFFGKLIGNIDPRKFSVLTYTSIILYISFLLMTVWFPQHFFLWNIKLYYVLIFYIIAHGVFAATMVLLWNIGSAYFCESHEAGTYQSIHLFLTGFRALFAPLMGVWFYENYGLTITFGLSIVSLIVAILINLSSYRRDRIAIRGL